MRPRPKRRRQAPSIDILIQSPLWKIQPSAEVTVRDAIDAAAAALPATEGEVSVVLADDAAIRALNRVWRGIDQTTNVLSFPTQPSDAKTGPPMLGDIVVAYEALARECADEGKIFLHHLSHLTVHGFLHLMGYDHATDTEAEAMERLESVILARLNIPDPYFARDFRDA